MDIVVSVSKAAALPTPGCVPRTSNHRKAGFTMASLSVIQSSLADYFRSRVQKRVHELVQPLSSEQVWQRPFPYGNSIGNLILHLTGNLNYYIGAQIGGTGYIRHRDLEFSDSGKPKDELLKAFDEAIQITVATIEKQSDQDWSAPYHAERADASTEFAQILACAGHAYHHIGQIIYLQRELLRGR
ncbi:MAG TPA: DinB family protein [Terriglobales bacterium]|nr:DinB family protein [Terriglobales bacterium]